MTIGTGNLRARARLWLSIAAALLATASVASALPINPEVLYKESWLVFSK